MSIDYSAIPGNIDVDILLPSTALCWAAHHNRPHTVQVLLEYGAEPNWKSEIVQPPIDWAAYFHHQECLYLMIEALEGKFIQTAIESKQEQGSITFSYGSLIKLVVSAADKFSMILRHSPQYLRRLHDALDLFREKTKSINFSNLFDGSMLYYAVSGSHDEVVGYMFKHSWWTTETLNMQTGDEKRTPILEAVRQNRPLLVQLLLDHKANIQASAANPFQPGQINWSALHIFAHEGHNKNLGLVKTLIYAGVPVDGVESSGPIAAPRSPTLEASDVSSLSLTGDRLKILSCETPLAVALRHNAFSLASVLMQAGADHNAITYSSGLFTSPTL